MSVAENSTVFMWLIHLTINNSGNYVFFSDYLTWKSKIPLTRQNDMKRSLIKMTDAVYKTLYSVGIIAFSLPNIMCSLITSLVSRRDSKIC